MTQFTIYVVDRDGRRLTEENSQISWKRKKDGVFANTNVIELPTIVRGNPCVIGIIASAAGRLRVDWAPFHRDDGKYRPKTLQPRDIVRFEPGALTLDETWTAEVKQSLR